MAKLTLSFKGHHLSIYHPGEAPTIIGRDETCGICIDSLAVAPKNAELISSDGEYLLLALDPEFPVLLNDELVDRASLHHGDLIQIGKHTLTFTQDTLELAPRRPATEPETEEPDEEGEEITTEALPAHIQIQSGRRIGKVIVFRRAVTRLSRAGAEDVVVTHDGDTYHLVQLEKQADIRIDGIPVADDEMEVQLHNNAIVKINDVRFQFFSGETDEPPGAAAEE
jgi:pSer/pThr/pTyr-binding forkhead associated (FHA) protein